MSFHHLPAHELLDLLAQGRCSEPDIAAHFQQRILDLDPHYKAFVRTSKSPGGEQEPAQVKSAVPLPIAIKDNICLKGVETTCCSAILKGFVPPYDATVIARLKEKGAFCLGQTNMDEFAFGSSTENSFFGPTRNPWDVNRVPGGSSGGSAAAVAAGETVWALGSDTGGSIRQPAAFCGVVGLKPTYGRVSRYGLIAFASSLDQIGPITRDVTDAALLLGMIAGHDEKDSTSADLPVPDYTRAWNQDIKGLRIGIPKEFFVEGIDPEVAEAVRAAIEILKKQGAVFQDVSLPNTQYSVATYYITATAEASSNLARFDGVRYGLRTQPDNARTSAIVDMFEETRHRGFGREAKRRIMLGTYALSSGYYDAYYLRGQKVRTLIKNDFDRVFRECDAVVTPTSPTTAFKIGEKVADPLSMYLSDIFTISANLSGLPAMSIPCGFSRAGLPIGLQIIAKPFAEDMLFRIAFHYEQQTPWHKQRPPAPKSDG